jgi:hypothetical protein
MRPGGKQVSTKKNRRGALLEGKSEQLFIAIDLPV